MMIRKATPSDIPVLISFQQSLASETEAVELVSHTLEQGMKAMFDDPSKGFYNIVEDEGSIVACHMITFEWSDWRNGMVWWLQSVYVIKDYRKKGVFRMMYQAVIDTIMKEPGIIGLRLYVDKSNQRAMKVYQSMGMNGDHYTVYEQMKS